MAEVSFCNPVNDYSYQWKVTGVESADTGSVIGSSLKITADNLEGGKQIEIAVSILNNQSMVMSSVSSIMSKAF